MVNIPGFLNYDIQVNDYFPETASELEDYMRKIASSYVGQMYSSPDMIRSEIEQKINNILLVARQRRVINEVLYCWVEIPENNPTSMNVELKTHPRLTPHIQYMDEEVEQEQEQLQLELPEEKDEGWSKEDLLKMDMYTKLVDDEW